MLTQEEMRAKLTCEELAKVERCVVEYETELLLTLMKELLGGAANGCWRRRNAMEVELKERVWEDNDE